MLIKHPLYLGHQIFRLNRADPIRDHRGQIVFGKPKPGYWEMGDCVRADCGHYKTGWVTTVDPATDRGAMQCHYIRTQSGRKFREEHEGDGLVRFVFEPGQKCFQQHEIPVQRDPVFLHIIPNQTQKQMDYDEFQDTMNETIVRINQNNREI